MTAPMHVRQQFQLLVAIEYAALKCLVIISLDEQHQIKIISNEEVMKQLIGCLEHPDLSTTINIDVLICIQNLSYNAYTHKYLTNVYLIDTLMKCYVQNLNLILQNGTTWIRCKQLFLAKEVLLECGQSQEWLETTDFFIESNSTATWKVILVIQFQD
ncbi:hypothetical protein EMCRGX_G003156 [Ephydatia muelleri]